MMPGDSQGTGQSNCSATCNHLENACKCGDGATNTVAMEGQIKHFLTAGPEEQTLIPIRRLENN